MGTGVDDGLSVDSHALDPRVVVIDGINLVGAGGRTEDIRSSRRQGMEVAEVEKEYDG